MSSEEHLSDSPGHHRSAVRGEGTNQSPAGERVSQWEGWGERPVSGLKCGAQLTTVRQ